MSLGEWVVRYRWWILALTTLVMVVASSGVRFLSFSNDYRVFFSDEDPQLQAFEKIRRTYGKHDNALIAIVPKNGNVFTRETLTVVEEFTRQAWQTPYSTRVDSITNFQHTWANGDELVVENLVEDAARATDDQIARARSVALSESRLLNRLINPDATVTAVQISFHLPEQSNEEVPEVVAFLRNMADEIRANHSGIDFYMTGVVFNNNAFREASRRDLKTLVPVMVFLVAGILFFILGSFPATVSTLVVIAFSILTAMGMAGWMGISLLPISANAPTIIMTLAVADSIHILITVLDERRLGKNKQQSIIESLRINHQPVFITSLTTAIGFLSLNFSDSPPFHDLGNIVAAGVVSAYGYSILVLPALLAILPESSKRRTCRVKFPLDRLGGFVIKRSKPLFWGIAGLFLVLGFQITQIEINEKFNEYFDTRYQSRIDNDFVTTHLTGVYSIQYSLGAGESGGIGNPQYLETLEKFADWYRKQPGVLYVETLADIMKRLNKNLHGDDASYYQIPDNRELAAQYLLLYELSLPFGLDLNNEINIDKSSSRFTVILENVSTREALNLESQAQEWLRKNAPVSMVSHGSSPLLMFSHIAERNLKAMMVGTLLALLLISGILVFALRSIRIGLISMIPNLAPILMTFGIWGLIFKEIGFAVAVVAPVALGIIVDDTVHFLSKYTRERREQGKSCEEAIRYSFHTVGSAITVTSVILTAGFLVLSYSGFTVTSHLGTMTCIAIASALLCDFFFLPTLLIRLDKLGDVFSSDASGAAEPETVVTNLGSENAAVEGRGAPSPSTGKAVDPGPTL